MNNLPRILLASGLAVSLAATLASVPDADAAIYDAHGRHLPDREASSDRVDWRPLRPSDQRSGVGVLGDWIAGDICTAFAIDVGPDSAPAHIMTNAHCNFFAHWGSDALEPDEHRTDVATWYHVTFHHYVPGVAGSLRRTRVPLARLEYVSENGTDIAIFRATWTVGELRTAGIAPLAFSTRESAPGLDVELVGVPLVHVSWAKMSLHRSACRLGPDVQLKNGVYSAPRSVVHRCSSVAGFSGGPMLDSSGAVVLINSHGAASDSADADCSYASRPCEVDALGNEVVREDRNYGQVVAGVGACFDRDGRFELGRRGCELPGADAAKQDSPGVSDETAVAGCQMTGPAHPAVPGGLAVAASLAIGAWRQRQRQRAGSRRGSRARRLNRRREIWDDGRV